MNKKYTLNLILKDKINCISFLVKHPHVSKIFGRGN